MRSVLPFSHSLVLLCGLLTIPACSVPGRMRQSSDHVFSTAAPHDLDLQDGGRCLPEKACYPGSEQHTAVRPMGFGAPSPSKEENGPRNADLKVSASAADDGVVRIASPADTTLDDRPLRAVEPAAHQQDDWKFASVTQDGFGQPYCPPGAPQFYPAEPRIDATPSPGVPRNSMETVAISALADHFPDEYVFDGGDRGMPVHYNGVVRRGLETEDTIVEYRDQAGDFQMTPSNRVAVYAPRFGSVRVVTGLEADVKYDGAAGARDALVVGDLNTGKSAQQNIQGVNPLQLLEQERLNGFARSLPPSQAAMADSAEQTRKIDNGHEGRAVTGASVFDRLDTPVLQEQLQNAVAWTREAQPVMTASTASASELLATFRLQEYVGVEDQRKSDGRIRIVKLADRSIAQAGDTIRFTIHFQNVGDFPVYDVEITDNLTPRLEYVPGSATIDEEHPGEVIVNPNGEGSHTLTFILDERLEGHSAGTITFETRVR